MNERILIIGAGAVGAYVGGYFARAGHEVILADPWPAHVEHMQAHGLRLEGMTEPECFSTPVRAMHLTDLQSLSKEKPADIAFVCVKSYDTPWAAALAKNYLAADGFIVSLQNGINEDAIASVVGWNKTIGCIASKIVVELVEPGFVRRSVSKGGESYTVFRVGEPHGRPTRRVERIHDMLADIDSVKVTTNLWGERWSKLVQNAMGNGLSAASGMSNKQFTQNETTRRLSIRLAGEAVRVGQMQGLALEKIGGIDPELWVAAAEELTSGANDTPVLDEMEAKMLAQSERMSDTARPSMGQDMIKGRRTEIEFLNGLVVQRANELGLEAPANAGLIAAVQLVERGDAPAGLERVQDI
ncbi:MAG: 2-dehydropantoate 2-reductase [Alphaproteobacteria bacterium]|jgi:2-dehydropantoate 2-reductase|nr:2-dehydropantoate 2-reductase [Alphaproteobacteria bacterium]MDP6829699.1 2-dehydropantoate 2-reductase [Alphaproteobacteria bacterium]MDP6873165.1 2-dehydropantoate 2-reductase [Alphaproteobacteria bacterium]